MVHFVGAGPGAVDLITVRGLSLLKEADVIIYAGSLVNPELLADAKKGCQIYNSAYMTLDDVIQVIVEAEERDLTTVRLHTGDPSLYGAIREQIDELGQRGISYDICPGVSSFFAAAASLGIEYTLPEISQSVILSRAGGRTPVPEAESLRALASHQATMVLFLSSSLAEKVKCELLAGGYDQDTPVAVVCRASWSNETILRTSLQRLPEDMERAQIKKTAVIIIGKILDGSCAKSKLYDASFTTEYRRGTNQ